MIESGGGDEMFHYGGPGTIYPHVEEIVIDEIDKYNKERFGVAIS